jgi:hypothetical protein
MTQNTRLRNGIPTGYAAGIYVVTRDGHQEFSHHGQVGGFAACLSYYPSKGMGAVVLVTGHTDEAQRLSEALRETIFGVTLRQVSREETADPDLGFYAGSYAFGSRQLAVQVERGTLTMETPAGSRARLRYRGNREFDFVGESGLRVAFVIHRSGETEYVVTRFGRLLALGKRL